MKWRIGRLTKRALEEAVVEHLLEGWSSASEARQCGTGTATVWVQDMVDRADRCGPLDNNCCGFRCECGVCRLTTPCRRGCLDSPDPGA